MIEAVCVLGAAFMLDLLLGDPRYPLHPVRLMGHGISFGERVLRRAGLDGRFGGIILVLAMETVSVAIYLLLDFLVASIFSLAALFLALILCYSCLALRDLVYHVNRVITALQNDDLAGAREAVGTVVGRDVQYLDKPGVCRAAIETLAENFVDGFFSPVFWYAAGAAMGLFISVSPTKSGICCMIGFKVASTLDSMAGYKTPEFLEFGWAGAKLDDLLNFVPARLSGPILAVGALITGLHPLEGLMTFRRDRLKHDSPNAAHAESFVAGALGIRLGGPTIYADGLKQKPWLAKGKDDPGPSDIQKTVHLIKWSAFITMIIIIPLSLNLR
ncbi:MAG: cobalamin biosynthesis protein CobD [Deltaproteobacteria bacterium]|nr:cobalamin biosynthesis protein CobD [Deltaproteobacteria bacterium]